MSNTITRMRTTAPTPIYMTARNPARGAFTRALLKCDVRVARVHARHIAEIRGARTEAPVKLDHTVHRGLFRNVEEVPPWRRSSPQGFR